MKYAIFKKIREEQAGENNGEKITELLKIYDMHSAEEKMLCGSDPFVQLSVMDKVVKLYSPIIRKENTDNQPNENM